MCQDQGSIHCTRLRGVHSHLTSRAMDPSHGELFRIFKTRLHVPPHYEEWPKLHKESLITGTAMCLSVQMMTGMTWCECVCVYISLGSHYTRT